MKIALAHDMAEALVGDITPHDNVTKVRRTHAYRPNLFVLLWTTLHA